MARRTLVRERQDGSNVLLHLLRGEAARRELHRERRGAREGRVRHQIILRQIFRPDIALDAHDMTLLFRVE